MGQVHGARLAGSVTPKFPDRCVLCGADQPGHAARFFASGFGVFFFVLWLQEGKKSVVAPACPGCALGARIGSLLRFAVSAAAAALGAWLLFRVVPHARAVDHFKALGVVLAAIVPILVWDQLFPAGFCMRRDTADGDVDYRFRSAADAAEFRALNLPPSHVWTAEPDLQDAVSR
jgi:hypothetical protein